MSRLRIKLFEGVCSNSRHPGHRRVWRGGSEQHLMTPLPDAVAAAADEFRDPLFLMTLSMISLTFAGHAPPKIGPKHQFERKKAPAGALSPSTVLLRGVLSVYKTETAILSSQKIGMSLFWRKRPLRARSALAPCFFVFTTYRFCLCYI